MKKRILKFLAGICQAAIAALLASAIIMPATAPQAALMSVAFIVVGLLLTILEGD